MTIRSLVRGLLSLIPVLALGCVRAETSEPLTVDASTFPPEAFDAFTAAGARLHAATGLSLLVDYGDCLGTEWCARMVPTLPGLQVGLTKRKSREILIETGHPEILEPTVLHELIHMLGFRGHTPGHSIMSKDAGAARDCITEIELNVICGFWDCSRFVPETCPDVPIWGA